MRGDVTSLTGADVLVKELLVADVKIIFAITGAGNLAIVDAIAREGSIKIVYSHHEQAAVMEAQGFARVTGQLGVALVTTGGGSSNVTTGVLSAYLDSVPILIISGNESSFHCENQFNLRAYGVQGFDSVETLKPVSKSAIRINSVADISNIFKQTISSALDDRMGPVHIDFPMDLQRKIAGPQDMRKFERKKTEGSLSGQLSSMVSDLNHAQKPLFYFGNGVRKPEALSLVREFVEQTGIPYIVSWSAIDLFTESDPQNVGRVGIYGDRHANLLLQKSDLLIAVGTRLAIPQLGYDKADFARKATKWVIDVDPTECAKFGGLGWNVLNHDAKSVMKELLNQIKGRLELADWRENCESLKAAFPRIKQLGPAPRNAATQIHSGEMLDYLYSVAAENAIIVTDVGAALLNGHYLYQQNGRRRFFTSQGLGEMGFGLPAAIGAYFAEPEKQIICLNTDGGIMFNLQELQLISEHQIPIKLFVFNNSGYSMIRISQENLFDRRLAGSTTDSGISFPSFKAVASTFKLNHLQVNNSSQLSSVAEALESPEAVLIEVMMDPEQKYFPRLATIKLPDGDLVSPPIEDLDPKIEIGLLEEILGYPAHENSYKARGLR